MSSYDPTEMADRFRLAADEFLAYMESIDGSKWRTTTDREGWPIGVVAHHVAMGAQFCGELALHVAAGGDITWTVDFIDQANSAHAHAFAEIGREEALDALRIQLPEAVKKIESLTESQLARDLGEVYDFGEGPVRFAGDVVEVMMTQHILDHMGSIKQVTLKKPY